MNNYEGTVKFWNDRFGKIVVEKKYYKPDLPIKLNELEEGLKWLVKDSDTIIDFGCGSGTLLFRSLFLGAKNGTGIDISSKAIELANQTAIENENNSKTSFIEGDIESLKNIETNSMDAAISSNTIDNILPQDALIVLKELNRILKKNAKLLVKLNDSLPKKVFEDDYYQLVSEDFYKEKCGLYLWNLSDSKFKEIVSPYFEIVKYVDVPFPKTDYKNRLYYLINIK